MSSNEQADKKVSKIKKPHELAAHENISMLIYGPPGTGKTTLGLSARSPLHIDADNGVHRVSEFHQKDTIPVDRWEDVLAIFEEDISEYGTMLVDTIGKLLQLMNEYVVRMNKRNAQADGVTLSQKGYGVRKELFMDFLKRASTLNKHVIFVGHEKEDKKGVDGNVYLRPDGGGSSVSDLIKELDLVGYMEVIGGQRVISFNPTETHYGKNTIGLPPMMDIPLATPSKNDFLTGIIDKFLAGAAERKRMGNTYTACINNFSDMAQGIKNADDANTAMLRIDEWINHVWDSKKDCKRIVFAKAAELGLITNTAERRFDNPAPPVEKEPEKKEAENKPANDSSESASEKPVDPVKPVAKIDIA